MRGDEIPREAIRNTLRSYSELHRKFDLFLSGQTESGLLIIARSGIGKSFYVKEHANHDITHIMEGNLRPLKTYMELYEHRHKLLVIDDGETLWSEKPGRHIMRQTYGDQLSENTVVDEHGEAAGRAWHPDQLRDQQPSLHHLQHV